MSICSKNWQKAIMPENSFMENVIQNLNECGIKIVLIVDKKNKFIGTISDGDIRRGLLKGLDIKSSIHKIINRNALVSPSTMSREMVLQLMLVNKIQQIPIVNEQQEVVGLHLWDEMTTQPIKENIVVIMAGGLGTRLMPHTENCPKPMVKIAGVPMLEHIIRKIRKEGFDQIILAIHHLGDVIEEYFGNGELFDVNINYLREDLPLGTAGALSLINFDIQSPMLVTNGDVITDISYREILEFHSRCQAAATMAVKVHEWQHPFGVVHTDGVRIIGLEEKPISRSLINAGVYVLSPRVLPYLSYNDHCDMPVLFERLRAKEENIVAYPMHEPWLDVGRPDDLQKILSV